MKQKSGAIFPGFIIIVLLPILLGMGSSGTGTPGKIPVPAKKFMGMAIDQKDVATEVREISIEGETYLTGKQGEGTFTIGFENIEFVNFLMSDGKLIGHVKLKDGKTIQIELTKKNLLYGKTSYGTFQIPLGDLKMLTIGNRKKNN
jgi:hypothetical protein